MRIAVYGRWHLAEVYAIGLCEFGHDVRLICNEETYKDYTAGKPPVFELGITEGIEKYVKKGKLSFSHTMSDPGNTADICFFAQDVTITPDGVDMEDILSHFQTVSQSGNFNIICISSQVPIGTCRNWQNTNQHVEIIYLPEFLRFGDALKRFTEPDYIVLGGEKHVVNKVWEVFITAGSPKFSVSLEEAEMTKHAANIFVAMTVSFVSELTKFSEHFDINFVTIGNILRADKRIGLKAYTLPGLGFSGTVERDIRVLLQKGKVIGKALPLFEQIIAVNNEHNGYIERELMTRFKSFANKKISFLGATYKPFTSNMRGSLVAPLAERLREQGAQVALYDPFIEKNTYTVDSLDAIFSDADAVIIAVAKNEFRDADYKRLVSLMKQHTIIDAANMFSREEVMKLQIDYSCIGRGRFNATHI